MYVCMLVRSGTIKFRLNNNKKKQKKGKKKKKGKFIFRLKILKKIKNNNNWRVAIDILFIGWDQSNDRDIERRRFHFFNCLTIKQRDQFPKKVGFAVKGLNYTWSYWNNSYFFHWFVQIACICWYLLYFFVD